MLRLYDIRERRLADMVPARGRELRVWSSGPVARRPDASDVRRLLLADLIRRAVQVHKLSARTWWTASDAEGMPPGQAAEPPDERALLADCAELNIHPPSYPPGTADVTGQAIDVRVGSAREGADDRAGDGADDAAGHGTLRCWVRAGLVRIAASTAADGPVAGSPAADSPAAGGLTERGLDPLALRLALLARPYRDPVTLTWEGLAQADAELRAWRWQVAGWATHSSRPMSARHVAAVVAAFDRDLATPDALGILGELAADSEVPPGARFETFAHLDQLLGLDLAREVGRTPPAGA